MSGLKTGTENAYSCNDVNALALAECSCSSKLILAGESGAYHYRRGTG